MTNSTFLLLIFIETTVLLLLALAGIVRRP